MRSAARIWDFAAASGRGGGETLGELSALKVWEWRKPRRGGREQRKLRDAEDKTGQEVRSLPGRVAVVVLLPSRSHGCTHLVRPAPN